MSSKGRNIILLEQAKQGDTDAENKFVSENTGLVHSLARRFYHVGAEYDDLFQAGCIGLLKALRSFDLSMGTAFSTYAVPVILGEIKRYLRDNGPIKVGRALKELSLKILRVRQRFLSEHGCEPTTSQLSELLCVSPEDIVMAIDACSYPLSLDTAIGEDDGDKEITLYDAVGDSSMETRIDRIALNEAMSTLEKEDRQLIVLRYYQGKTQNETAKQLNMTQVQVSRREKKVLERLRIRLYCKGDEDI